MAKNRSRRLRKKMHIDEFQELGFSVAWRFPEGTSEEQHRPDGQRFDRRGDRADKLAFDGSGYFSWKGSSACRRLVSALKSIRLSYANGWKRVS